MKTGNGKFMRHIILRPKEGVDAVALERLIAVSYAAMKRRLEAR